MKIGNFDNIYTNGPINKNQSSAQPSKISFNELIKSSTTSPTDSRQSQPLPKRDDENTQQRFLELIQRSLKMQKEIIAPLVKAREDKEVADMADRIEKEVEIIKKNSETPTSIFDNEDIPQDVKDYLADKNMTAVRYQRLYEEDPRKADLFLNNIKTNGDHAEYDMDEKYKDWEYIDVLKQVNALLTLNYNDVLEGNHRYANQLQTVFTVDDEIGVKYDSIRKGPEKEFKQLGGNYEYIPLGGTEWVSGFPEISEAELSEMIERLDKGITKISLHNHIGVSQKTDYSMYIENGLFDAKNRADYCTFDPSPLKRSLVPVRSVFYNSVY